MKDINENKLISPQIISKSSLFTISTASAKRRNKVENKLVYNHANVEMYLTGYELTVRDEDVLLALLQQAERHTSLSYKMSLKELTQIAFGRSDTRARRTFIESIEMLYAADVTVIDKNSDTIMNSRIIYNKLYNPGELFRVSINEDMVNLLNITNFQSKSLRYKLNNLTKKIYSYVSSNNGYAYVSFNSLYQLTGSSKSRMDHFKSDCIDAFDELKREGVISQYRVADNVIHYTVKSYHKVSYKQAVITNQNNEMKLRAQEILANL